MEKVKLSLVIPVYNTEEWLERCLNSVVDQNYDFYEVIIVNDGSTDHSGEIIDRFVRKYSFIRVINQQNKGVSGARNSGMLNAKGEYIAFIDSDDFIDPTFCKVMMGKANGSDVVICGHRSYYYGEFKKNYIIIPPKRKDRYEAASEFFKKENCAHIVVTKVFRKEMLLKNHILFEEGRLFEDMLFSFDVICHAERFEFVDKILYTYWRHTDSLSVKANVSKLDDYRYGVNRVIEQKYKVFGKESFHQEIMLWMLNNIFSLGKFYLNSTEITREQYEKVFREFEKLLDLYKYN